MRQGPHQVAQKSTSTTLPACALSGAGSPPTQVSLAMSGAGKFPGGGPMKKHGPTMAQQIAQAIRIFQEQQTGHPPKTIGVDLSDKNLLIVTLDSNG